MKHYILFLFYIQILLVICPIPNWELSSQGIEITSEEIEVYNKKNHGYTVILKKKITKSGSSVSILNQVSVTKDSSTKTKTVEFDDIGGHFGDGFYTVNKLIICPKGKFHPYDFYNDKYITPPNNFQDLGNWDLRCYYHQSVHFLVFYFHNGNYKFFSNCKDANDKTIRDYYLNGDELYDYILEDAQNWDLATQNRQYKFPILVRSGDLKLYGTTIIMNKEDNNCNQQNPYGKKSIISLKSNSQAYFDSDKYFYFFTYNDISDFTSGYSTTSLNYDNYGSNSISSITFTQNTDSPLSFLDNVEIRTMNFISGTQYVYYKIYDKDTSKYFYGLIDVKLNKVIYNIEKEEDATFIPYTSTSSSIKNDMLLISSSYAYKICAIKSGSSCIESCSNNLILDPDKNYCSDSDSCGTGKIKLMPEDICISSSSCDTTKYIIQGSKCGLCSYFNPNGPKYRLIGSEGCLNEKPNNSEDYNVDLFLLKCKTNYKVEGTSCIPEYCYETCLTCSEISSDSTNQKCSSCKSGYQLNNGNCILIPTTVVTMAPTTVITEAPTTEEAKTPSTIVVTPTTEEVKPPTTNIVVPTTEEVKPPTTILVTPTTEEVKPPTTVVIETSAPTDAPSPLESCSNKRCKECSPESDEYELCISCDEDLYAKVNYTYSKFSKFYDCLEKKKVESKFFYDEESHEYKPCYKTCKKCSGLGNVTDQHCLECDEGYMLRPGDNPKNNCVVYSEYYYLSPYNEYKPLNSPQCPEEAKYQINDEKNNKTSCIYDCKADNVYKYLYNGKCLKSCEEANGTTNVNFICKETDPDKIYISQNELYLDNNDTIQTIQTLAIAYAQEYNYTDNHISQHQSSDASILLYKNPSIIGKSGLKAPDIDFGDCYEKVKKAYNITGNLIIAVADKKVKNNPSTFYLFFHPVSGVKLEVGEICKNESIEIKENLLSMLDEKSENYELQTALTQQGINIFDINDPYYKDICYDFVNPKNRDMALKDRIKETYVNVTLCDDGCVNTGIDIINNVATCDCKFNDVTNNDLIHENAALEYLVGEFFDLINTSNIFVLRCYKNLLKYFKRSKGAIIIIILFILSIIFASVFISFELTKMKRYIFSLTEKFTFFLTSYPILAKFFPPKRKSLKNKTGKIYASKMKEEDKKIRNNKKVNTTKNSISNFNKQGCSKDYIISNKKSLKIINIKEKGELLPSDELEQGKQIKRFFKNYLSTPLDEMEFDDAIKRDRRSFCGYFCDNLKEKQTLAYTFIASDPINTRMIKLVLFCLNINLYFVINGLFFSETYISKLYHLDEKDENFFSFIPRTIDKIFYTAAVSVVIGYLTDFFFLDESKVKGIFKREKENKIILKRSIAMLIKEIQKRYTSFIIMSFFIFVISLYYILCFNYVYPKTQTEWIKSSVLIIIIMQILSVLKCLFEAIFRFLSFKLESEQLYKVGNFFANNS